MNIHDIINYTYINKSSLKIIFNLILEIYFKDKYKSNELFVLFLLNLKNIRDHKKSNIDFIINLLNKSLSRFDDNQKSIIIYLCHSLKNITSIFQKHSEFSDEFTDF